MRSGPPHPANWLAQRTGVPSHKLNATSAYAPENCISEAACAIWCTLGVKTVPPPRAHSASMVANACEVVTRSIGICPMRMRCIRQR